MEVGSKTDSDYYDLLFSSHVRLWKIPPMECFKYKFFKQSTNGTGSFDVPLLAKIDKSIYLVPLFKDTYHWCYYFRFHRLTCTEVDKEKCCMQFRAGEIILFKTLQKRDLELPLMQIKNKKVTDANHVWMITDHETGISFGQASKAPYPSLFVCRHRPTFYPDLWFLSNCPHIPFPAKGLKGFTNPHLSPSQWQNMGFTPGQSIQLAELVNTIPPVQWTSNSLLFASPPSQRCVGAAVTRIFPSSVEDGTGKSPMRIVMEGYNLHLPSVVLFQNGESVYALEPKKAFFSSLTADFGSPDWGIGRYDVCVATSIYLKMCSIAGKCYLLSDSVFDVEDESFYGLDIDSKTRVTFLGPKGIDLNFVVTRDNETYPILSFFIHLIIPLLEDKCYVIGLLNRAFYHYILRLTMLHKKLKTLFLKTHSTWKPIDYAASFGSTSSIKDLFRRPDYQHLISKEDPVTVSPNDSLPLLYAIESKQKGVASLLIKKSRKMIKAVTADNISALHVAAMYGKTDLIKKIALRCNHLETETTSTKETPLFLAAMSGKKTAIEVLLSLGAKKNKKNHLNLSPEDIALSLGFMYNINVSLTPKSKQYDMLKDKLNSQKACKLEDFEIKQKLGQGAFGEVWLAVDKFTGNKVALKQMHKQFIISKGKKEHVTNEKKLLNRAKIQNSRFLLTLYTSFQTINDIYLAMEYCPGGDLREFLEAIGSLEEEEAKLWFAEMIIAVHSLHKLGYIHRDLKPDNFLIDAKGHIKLGDFGLSKQTGTRPTNFGPPVRVNATAAFRVRKKSLVAPLQLRKAYSVVGSPQYMSPEVLKGRESSKGTTPPSKEGGFKLANQQNQGYSEEVDWWSLGCVFFECILGEPPFSGDSVEEVFNSIENWSEVIPETLKLVSDSVTPEFLSLLNGFLSSAKTRIGRDLKFFYCHPFFHDTDWENLHLLPSSFVPSNKD